MDVQAEDQEVAPLVEAEVEVADQVAVVEDQGEVAVVALQAAAPRGLVQQEAVVEGTTGA